MLGVDLSMAVKAVVIFAAVVSVAYAFAKVVQATGSFAKGILTVSILVDFYLILMFILGIDRPLFQLRFARVGATVTITALTIFIPVKLLFTIYLFIKSKQLQAVID